MTNAANMTAAELRASAAQHRADAAESFERCDTDGFVSQWASGINAQVADRNAEIADGGGKWLFARTTLVTLDGEPTDARAVDTRYGTKWRSDAADKWLPYMPARPSTLAKHGYREVTETIAAPAKAITWAPSGARGLSGATSVCVIVIRTDVDAREGREWRPAGPVTNAPAK